jgi:hypothetical protein
MFSAYQNVRADSFVVWIGLKIVGDFEAGLPHQEAYRHRLNYLNVVAMIDDDYVGDVSNLN